MHIYSVSDVSQYLKGIFVTDPVLFDVWIRGEVSNLTRSAAGHTYWTLKDRNGQLKCVMFRREAQWNQVRLDNGMSVLAHGRVDVYEAAGAYQLYVDLLEPQGLGLLYLRFEQLKQRLEAEGLFDTERKRPIPTRPRCIGILTSPTGAVLHDIVRVIGRRYPFAEVVLSPAVVQGRDGAASICQALELLNTRENIDVIIVARGGGSLEDLWCFNEETVARAIYASRIPIISGVGHETDFTIADMVADLRAATPSVAAELAVPSIEEDREKITDYRDALDRAMSLQLLHARDRLNHVQQDIEHHSPRARIETQRQHIDDLLANAAFRVRTHLARSQAALANGLRHLTLVDPRAVVQRGYAIVRDPSTERLVTSIAEATPGQLLEIHVRDGRFPVRVESSR